jgi:peptide-methionine (S)-S-oxide reductase
MFPYSDSRIQSSGFIVEFERGPAVMERPYLGKLLATAVIVIFFAWTAIRALGARPAETPNASVFPKPTIDAPLAAASQPHSAVFAGGCFWGVQAVFEHVKGVKSATSGYSGGRVKSPSYELVSMGVTGHAESVQVNYDPSRITYGQLLMIYFSVAHDPTQLNRQGPDTGSQYRSAIFYSNDETETHRRGLHRPAEFRRSLFTPNRHKSRALRSVLPCRRLSSGLLEEKSRQLLHRLQRFT